MKSILRYFSRYGIRLNEFREAIKDKKPDLLKNTGFTNPHFGLETLNSKFQKEWGDKITTEEAIKGINFLTGKMHLKNTWIRNGLQTKQLPGKCLCKGVPKDPPPAETLITFGKIKN